MEKVGGGVCIFMWGERPSMFRFMSRFSKFILFVVSMNVRMSLDFMYGESMSSFVATIGPSQRELFYRGGWFVRRGV